MQHVHTRVGRRQLIGELTRAIGRVVVNDQDVESRILGKDQRNDAGDILALVIRRDDHEGAFAKRE